MKSFSDIYGPWAVVTGASSGIGAEFVRQLAEKKMNVVLIARRQEQMDELAGDLVESFGVKAKVIRADLCSQNDLELVIQETAHLDVGILINNAGMEFNGSFLHSDVSKHMDLISLNVSAVTKLAHVFGRRFSHTRKASEKIEKRSGIIFVSSIAKNPGFCPWMSTYSASKGFVSNLAYIMNYELSQKNIDILSLEPGVVDTPMAKESEFDKLGWPICPTNDCVSLGLNSLKKGVFRVTPGQEIDEDADKQFLGGIDGVAEVMKKAWTNKEIFDYSTDSSK